MWKTVIGLEIHAQLLTSTKLFCSCPANYGDSPNSNVCPVCFGLPGALPVLNGEAVRQALRAALLLNCRINRTSSFDRKNYFYPDLSKGYQITQFFHPYAENGYMEIEVGGTRRIGITRIHIEEDAGKSFHDEERGETLVDFNRCGTPLIEIVSEPDLETPEAAAEYLRRLRELLVYAGVNDGNLEEGSLRCDANISLHREGEPLGTRVEIKNLNSYRFLQRALRYEQERQAELLERGEEVGRETRLFDVKSNRTMVMRTKEQLLDYRYFPEPDLGILRIEEEEIRLAGSTLPETPALKRERYVREYHLSADDAKILVSSPSQAAFYEETVKLGAPPVKAAHWLLTELLQHASGSDPFLTPPLTPKAFADLLVSLEKGRITAPMAKDLLPEMIEKGLSATELIAKKGIALVDSPEAVKAMVKGVLEGLRPEVERYRAGETKLLGFLIGEVMKSCKGAAQPKTVNQTVREFLEGKEE